MLTIRPVMYQSCQLSFIKSLFLRRTEQQVIRGDNSLRTFVALPITVYYSAYLMLLGFWHLTDVMTCIVPLYIHLAHPFLTL